MGKTRIAALGEKLSSPAPKVVPQATDSRRPKPMASDEGKKPKHKKSLKEERGVRAPGLKGGERVVAVIAEPLPEEPSFAKATEGEEKVRELKPPRKRGKRYLAAKALVKPNKSYPPAEAIKLAQSTSISRFNGSFEIHMVVTQAGKEAAKKAGLPVERSQPLVHASLGKLDDSELETKLRQILRQVGEQNIKKATVAASMGPSIRLEIASQPNTH